MSNTLKTYRSGNTQIVRFDLPEIRNPLSSEVLSELEAFLDGIDHDKSIKKILFTGTDGVFASGADLREIDRLSAAKAPEFARRGQQLMDKIAALGIEAYAAINGPCLGGALDLALACSHRIASPDATFCHPGAGLGIITGWGGTQRLPRLIGETNALKLFLTAAPISADEALRIGLIDQIVSDPLSTIIDS